MVTLNTSQETWGSEFVIRPNRSASWTVVKAVFLFFLLVSAVVGTYFWAMGAWLVLPFTGAEMLVLGLAFYWNARCGQQLEVIRVGASDILVQKGQRRAETEDRFHRHWAKVTLVRDPKNWYPSRLFIGSHGRSAEIGSCLLDGEREQLARELRRVFEIVPEERSPLSDCRNSDNNNFTISWG